MNVYIVVPLGQIPQIYFSRPRDWPSFMAAKRIVLETVKESEALEKTEYDLRETKILFETVERFLLSRWHDMYYCFRPMRDEGFLGHAHYTMDMYEISLILKKEGEETRFNEAIIHKTNMDDFFHCIAA